MKAALTLVLTSASVALATHHHLRHAHSVRARSASSIDIDAVLANGLAVSTHPWELGVIAEAQLEVQTPSLTVWEKGSIPIPASPEVPDEVYAITKKVVDAKPLNQTELILDGAAGDPASLGFAVLLINSRIDNETWAQAADQEIEYLYNEVPQTEDGGISHRHERVQLWSDFVYMVPPYLAYYGAVVGGDNATEFLRSAHHQCSVYREVLYDADASLWEHILLGNFQFTNHWGTGNGWAALGMVRTLATIQASAYADELESEQKDLIDWTDEILTGTWAWQKLNGTLYNTIDGDDFADTSGTAALAAASYRLARITGNPVHIPAAERAYELIAASVNATGWLQGTVNPQTFNTQTEPDSYSPEGQSFTLMLVAARDAYYKWL
ncbi:hypothetical protein PENSPDRAFT_635206 [Peniophora sp. CONT]|nr:hypothetical protein PENSPDRAFT_635206 [Peniophora sp. CONT]